VVETGRIKSEINRIIKEKVKLEKMGHDERSVETVLRDGLQDNKI
jgi:hypothetical protein